MRKKNIVILKTRDRIFLKGLVSKGGEKARMITRGRILLMSDKGTNDTAIIRILDIARNTIRQVRQRYAQGGLNFALQERSRSGAPAKIDGRQKAKITALACSDPPEGRGRWTLRLLAGKVVELDIVNEISHMQVGRILKKTKSNPI